MGHTHEPPRHLTHCVGVCVCVLENASFGLLVFVCGLQGFLKECVYMWLCMSVNMQVCVRLSVCSNVCAFVFTRMSIGVLCMCVLVHSVVYVCV